MITQEKIFVFTQPKENPKKIFKDLLVVLKDAISDIL